MNVSPSFETHRFAMLLRTRAVQATRPHSAERAKPAFRRMSSVE
jgi:hypothetical protein